MVGENPWIKAGIELGIEVVAPHRITLSGVEYECAAYFPHFGGGLGALVREFDKWKPIDASFMSIARDNGYFASMVVMRDFRTYDRTRFVEMLSDWGYFGPSSSRPNWLIGRDELFPGREK